MLLAAHVQESLLLPGERRFRQILGRRRGAYRDGEFAGIAGGLNAHYTFTIGPGNYAFENAVDILTMAVFGGTGNLIGPTIGATILTLLPEVLRQFKDFRLAANGLILVLVILYLPKGIWDPRRIRAFRQRRKTGKAA